MSGRNRQQIYFEVFEHAPDADRAARRALYARAGVEMLWTVDLGAHTTTGWWLENGTYALATATDSPRSAKLAPFERTRVRPGMVGDHPPHDKEPPNMRDGPIPAPFALMNHPVPTCAARGCGRPVLLEPPRGHSKFCGHTFVPAIIALLGMDRLPNGVDWFVVAARDTDGQRQVITIGDDDGAEARTAMIERTIEDLPNAYAFPPGCPMPPTASGAPLSSRSMSRPTRTPSCGRAGAGVATAPPRRGR